MKKVLHIYLGTTSTGGSYLNEILNTLSDNCNQTGIVNYYYPYNTSNNIKKHAFRYSETIGGRIKNEKLRLFARYLELIFTLLYSIYILLKYKPDVINYSLTMNISLEYYFLRIAKKISPSIQLITTIHDAQPSNHKLRSNYKKEKVRNKIFTISDSLLTHNKYSMNELIKQYNVDKSKIIHHLFPPMRTVFTPVEFNYKTIDYLFTGWLRPEKGIDILLDAWMSKDRIDLDKKLYLVGKLSVFNDLGYTEEELFKRHVIVINEFVSDKELAELMASAKYLILPYKQGTNSGFPIMAIQNNCIPIVSDLEMFQEMDYLSKECFFESNNVKSLISKFNELDRKDIELKKLKRQVEKYKEKFKLSVRETYAQN